MWHNLEALIHAKKIETENIPGTLGVNSLVGANETYLNQWLMRVHVVQLWRFQASVSPQRKKWGSGLNLNGPNGSNRRKLMGQGSSDIQGGCGHSRHFNSSLLFEDAIQLHLIHGMSNAKYIYIQWKSELCIPGTQMTLVLIGTGFLLEGLSPTMEDIEVPDNYISIYCIDILVLTTG